MIIGMDEQIGGMVVAIDLLTVHETAQLLRVSPLTIRRYVADGRLAAVKVGRGVRIQREAVAQLLEPVMAGASESEEHALSAEGRFSHTDSLWNIVGIAESDGPGDVSADKHKYLADAYGAHQQ
jgi:excisionase family DNA binding protein